MSRSVQFKLRGPALEAALRFSDELGMPLNLAAERALIWAIRQAYASQPAKEGMVPNVQADVAGDTGQSPADTADSGDPLAQPETVADPLESSDPGLGQ